MNEHELRDALHGVMVASSPPPPMDGMATLEAARRVRQRRRTTAIACAGTALAIVVITVGALLAAGPSGPWGGPVVPAAPPTPAEPGSSTPDTQTVWPTGPDGQPQQDRTATAGPRADQAVRLEFDLRTSVPPGFTVPPDQPAPGTQWAGPLRWNQSQFVDRADGKEVWQYLSRLPITRDGKTGFLFAEIYTAGNKLPGDLCEGAKTLWGGVLENTPVDYGWQCQEMTVGNRTVGVVSGTRRDHSFDQWAYYRHEDGTAVFIAQAREFAGSGLPGLAEQPLTLEQLAALAVDPRFRLS